MNFSSFELNDTLLDAIDAMGFTEATPIQQEAIPAILSGKDIIGCAQTGTGKTAAFLLPVLQHITENPDRGIQCLIMVPTRELALQIDQQVVGLSYFTDVSSAPVYGGTGGEGFSNQKKALVGGADIIVATPGAFLSHLKLGHVNLDQLKFFVLDEADRMLDMGFLNDIMFVYRKLPRTVQSLMFSATMPKKIRDLAKNILMRPYEINIAISKPSEKIDQKAFMVFPGQKSKLIERLLTNPEKEYGSVIIFSSTKRSVDDLQRLLQKTSIKSDAIHSDLDQAARKEILNDFKNGKFNVLVATDIISRGIDIDSLDLVVNYVVPSDPEDYVHRVGRTARAQRQGEAITFITPEDQHKFQRIEQLIEREIPKLDVPKELGETPEYNPGKPRSGGGGGSFRKSGGNSGGGRHPRPGNNQKSGQNYSQQRKGGGGRGRKPQ